MKALIWKEVKELAPGFWLLLGSCWVIGAIDVAYNWNEEHLAGLSLVICAVISFVAALLAGANSFARESREQTVFLGSWPITRGRIWLAKVGVPAVLWVLLVALGTGGCAGLLSLAGHDVWKLVTTAFAQPQQEWWVFVASWSLLFAAGLLVSVSLESAMAAAVVTVLGLMGAGWVYMWAWKRVPLLLGPKVGFELRAIDQTTHLVPAVVVAGICVVASLVVVHRGLFRTWPRRGLLSVGTAVGLLAAVLLGGLATVLITRGAFPADYHAEMDGSGRYVVITALAGHGSGLWSFDVQSGALRRICRGEVHMRDMAADAPRVLMDYSPMRGQGSSWVADLATAELWRVDHGHTHYGTISRDGRLVAGWDNDVDHVHIREVERNRMVLTRDFSGLVEFLHGLQRWSPDGRTVYARGGTPSEGDARHRLLAIPLAEGSKPRIVHDFGQSWDIRYQVISPDGRWMPVHRREDYREFTDSALLDLTDGGLRDLGDLLPFMQAWTGNGRYLWGRPLDSSETPIEERIVKVLDTRTWEVVRTLDASDLDGRAPANATTLGHSDHVLIFAVRRRGAEGLWRGWWVADPDGTNLRPLEIGSEDDMVGWADGPELVLLRDRVLQALNVETGDRRLIGELPAAEDVYTLSDLMLW